MEDHDITEAWKEHFPKWRHDKVSAQTCRLLCGLLQDRVRHATTLAGLTPDERLQRVLDACGVPRAQFDEVCSANRH
jgi:hypothetical protein